MTAMTCQEPQTVGIGILIMTGLIVSYTPQVTKTNKYLSIHHSKSRNGISTLYLLLGLLSSTTTLANTILLQKQNVECCKSFWYCFQAIQASLQCLVQFCCFVLFCLICSFYDTGDQTSEERESLLQEDHTIQESRAIQGIPRTPSILMNTMITIVTTAAISFIPRKEIPLLLGLTAAFCTCIQFIPQVLVTLKSGFQSLSIVMLLIQFPGSIVFVYSIMKQQGTDWTTWIPFFVCGVFQLILILIYLYQKFVCVGFGYERVADEVVVQGSVDSE